LVTGEVVSDINTVVTDGNVPQGQAAVLAWEHSNWTDTKALFSGSGAEWIWETYKVVNEVDGDVVDFQRTFDIPGTPTIADEFLITCDNGYEVYVNGTLAGSAQVYNYDGTDWQDSDLTESYVNSQGWNSPETYDVSALLQGGTNFLEIQTANEQMTGGTEESNPGGLIFQLPYEFNTGWEEQDVKIDLLNPELVKTVALTGLDEVTITLTGVDPGNGSGIDYIEGTANGNGFNAPGGGATNLQYVFKVTGAGEHQLTHVIFDVAGRSYRIPAQVVSIAALGAGATPPPPLPELVVNFFGEVSRHPVSPSGHLLETVRITSPDGNVTLEILAGTLVLNFDGTPTYMNTDPDMFTIAAGTPPPPPGHEMVVAYEFNPSGITFTPEATLIIEYPAENMPAGSMGVIAYYDEAAGEWVDLETAGYVAAGEPVPNTLTCHTGHLTYFAVLAKLPAAQ